MKFLLLLPLIFLTTGALGGVGDTVTTNKEAVGEIRAQTGGIYYFTSVDGNWSTPGCPNAVYAYFRETLTIGKEIYSAALASKLSKTPIKFKGSCGDGSGNDRYILITYMTF